MGVGVGGYWFGVGGWWFKLLIFFRDEGEPT